MMMMMMCGLTIGLELIPVLCNQPVDDITDKPCSTPPVLSAWPAFTFPATGHHRP